MKTLRRRHTDEDRDATARQCFNCASQPYGPTPLCRECLRMAIITSALGGVSAETLHRLMALMFPQ